MIYHVPSFRPPIFFGELIAKKFKYWDFSEGKRYIFDYVFTISLEMLMFLH